MRFTYMKYVHIAFRNDFSPTIFFQPILESGAVELLCSLTLSENPALRVNGIWALMVSILLLI